MTGENMLHCHEVLAQLWQYIDAELTQELAAQVEAHLDMCQRCFPQYNFHRAFVTFIGTAAEVRLPKHVRRRIFARLLAEESGGSAASSAES